MLPSRTFEPARRPLAGTGHGRTSPPSLATSCAARRMADPWALRSAGRAELESCLHHALRVWRTDEVATLSPHPNDRPAGREDCTFASADRGSEFFTTFTITSRPDTERSCRNHEASERIGPGNSPGTEASCALGAVRRRSTLGLWWPTMRGRCRGSWTPCRSGNGRAWRPFSSLHTPATGIGPADAESAWAHRTARSSSSRGHPRASAPDRRAYGGTGGCGDIADDPSHRGCARSRGCRDISDPATSTGSSRGTGHLRPHRYPHQRRRCLPVQALHRLHGRRLRAVVGVNLTGFFRLTQLAITHMLTRGAPRGQHHDHPRGCRRLERAVRAHRTHQGGVAAATRSLAIEHASRGIRVNASHRASFKRRHIPRKATRSRGAPRPTRHVGQVGDVVNAILFLESSPSSPVRSCTSTAPDAGH